MKLEHLEEFLVLAETMNYSEAADKLYISTSALSRHVILLEEELGEELFSRGTRTVTLTNAGIHLITYAKKMLELKRDYLDTLERERTVDHQNLSLGFTYSIVSYGIMDMLIEFRQRNPDINVMLAEHNTSRLMQMVRNSECNFALCYQYEFMESNELKCMELVHDTLAVALPRTHPLATAKRVTLEELKTESFILHVKGGASYQDAMKLFEQSGIIPKISSHAESGEYIMTLVSRGMGISIVEKLRFRHNCPENVRIVDLEPRTGKNVAIYFKKRELNTAEKRFMDFLEGNLQHYIP